MKCPRCGSDHVQYATRSYGGGTSLSKSCCGYILLGPLGILCGMCNSGVHTEEFWVCNSCGHQFSNFEARVSTGIEDWKQDRDDKAEGARLQAIEDARIAKEKYEAYKKDISHLEQTSKTYTRLKAEHSMAHEQTQRINDRYLRYVKHLRHHEDKQIRKTAKRALPSTIKWILPALWFISALIFVDASSVIALVLFCIGFGRYCFIADGKKEARAALVDMDSRYARYWNALSVATEQENQLKQLIEKIDYVRQYESEHYQMGIELNDDE